MTQDQQKLIDAYIPVAERWEKTLRTMYLDSLGNVTAGDGFLLRTVADAQKLPWRVYGRAASSAEVAAEYSRVNAMPVGYKAEWYSRPMSPSLTREAIRNRLGDIIAGLVVELYSTVTMFAGLPFAWKLALLDMAYNMGIPHLLSGWPNLWQGIRDRKEGICAKECIRPQVGLDRNSWTQRQFLVGITENQAMQ